jgi:FKBP-type peptidyl-prolyl cis-trans isomerase (trigger factor)
MQVTETLNDGLKRGYTITVTAAELDAKVTEKLEEARPEIEMKGFRKGKVPMALLRKQFGPRVWAMRCRKPSMAPCATISRRAATARRCSRRSR